MKLVCAVCNHEHDGKCPHCHCAQAVATHPQGKKPFQERFNPEVEARAREGFALGKKPHKFLSSSGSGKCDYCLGVEEDEMHKLPDERIPQKEAVTEGDEFPAPPLAHRNQEL